jgi:hypothetical protein
MLLDSVQRMDSKGMIKKVSIDSLKQTHPNVFKQLQMVPALMLLPSKEILYGKAAFDYLLLPSRGKLVVGGGGGVEENRGGMQPAASGHGTGNILHVEEGIMAFNGLKGGYADSFADINETQATPSDPLCNPHTSFQWTSIEEMMRSGSDAGAGVASSSPAGGAMSSLPGMNVETRGIKEAIDMDSIRQQRDRDLQALYSGQPMPTI